MRTRFPAHRFGYHFGVARARELGRLDEARDLLAQADPRFPNAGWLSTEAVLNLAASGRIDLAITRLAGLTAKFPLDQNVYRTSAILYRSFNCLDEAVEVCGRAAAAFPEVAWFPEQAEAIARLKENHSRALRLAQSLVVPKVDSTARVLTFGRNEIQPPPSSSKPARRKVIVVLGMHRAGTSLCARLLQDLGVYLGAPLAPPNFGNADGHYEHETIVELNDALLAAMNATWDTVWTTHPSGRQEAKPSASASIRERIKIFLKDQIARSPGVFGFKDPRTMRLLPVWDEIFDELGVEPIWLLSVRDPRAVAASLQTRNRLPAAIGELLWVEHYLDALGYLGPRIAGVFHYEQWFSAGEKQIDHFASAAGLTTGVSGSHIADAVRLELNHKTSGSGRFTLDLSNRIYSWITSKEINLSEIQARSVEASQELCLQASSFRTAPETDAQSPVISR